MERINLLHQEATEILNKILQNYEKFYGVQSAYCEQYVMHKGNVTIMPKAVSQLENFQQNMSGYFDARSSKNSKILYYRYASEAPFMAFMKESLKSILMKQYILKSDNTEMSVAEDIFSTNPFEIEYNINYQGDNLADMSEGNILRLLLEFSTNEYPILIDQPEDDLDNRVIFGDLVSYLREKKE